MFRSNYEFYTGGSVMRCHCFVPPVNSTGHLSGIENHLKTDLGLEGEFARVGFVPESQLPLRSLHEAGFLQKTLRFLQQKVSMTTLVLSRQHLIMRFNSDD